MPNPDQNYEHSHQIELNMNIVRTAKKVDRIINLPGQLLAFQPQKMFH